MAPHVSVANTDNSRRAYITFRGNFCMMLSHPSRCLKGIPSSNESHVGSLKYVGRGGGVM